MCEGNFFRQKNLLFLYHQRNIDFSAYSFHLSLRCYVQQFFLSYLLFLQRKHNRPSCVYHRIKFSQSVLKKGDAACMDFPDFLESAVPNQFLDSCMTVAARVWPEAGTRCTRAPFFIYADPAPNSVCDGYSSTRLQLIMCRQAYSRWWKEKISQGWSRVHSSVGHVDILPVRGLSTTTSTE